METTYFGQNDTTTEQLQQRRREAIELFRQQKEIIEQRQRQLLLRQMRDQEYETDVLKSIKEESVEFFLLFFVLIDVNRWVFVCCSSLAF